MKVRLISIWISVVFLHISSIREIAANLCPVGSWSDNYDDVSHCLPCASGHYCPLETAFGRGTVLKACLPGTYLPYTGASSIDECSKCHFGTYAAGEGYAECYKCPRGTYCDVTGLTAHKSCPSGTYQPDLGGTSFSACLQCPSGTIQPQTGGYECYPCPDGYTCTDPTQRPVPIEEKSLFVKVSSTLISRTTINTLTLRTDLPTQIPGKNCFDRMTN